MTRTLSDYLIDDDKNVTRILKTFFKLKENKVFCKLEIYCDALPPEANWLSLEGGEGVNLLNL